MTRLNDQDLVQREYATDERVRHRRLDVWADVAGDDPERVALAALAEVEPKRVLDAGCGTGEFASRILARKIVGIDSSSFMVDRARENGVDARVAYVESMPFTDDEFDAASCNWVLYHLRDLDRGLAELARVLRPGGRLVAITNSERHLEELWSALGRKKEASIFTAENGEEALLRHFSHVERRDVEGTATWATHEALQRYLDAFSELIGDVHAPEAEVPLQATRRNSVLVAER